MPERAGAIVPDSEQVAPKELAKPEDDIRVSVQRYMVSPSAPQPLKDALDRITKPYIGPNRSYEDLVNAVAEVTRFLQRDLGYYLGFAYLPEQEPVNGEIRIAVLEGRLDRVILNWSDDVPVDKAVVEGYLRQLKPGDILKVRDVERVVFLVNDLRGLTARFEVQPGTKPGTASLVVTPIAEKRIAGRVDVDANGSRFLGTERAGATGVLASPFGRGDSFSVSVLSSFTGGLKFGLLSYTLPVGSDGWRVGASIAGVNYELDSEALNGLQFNGNAATASGFALYPAVRSRNLNLFVVASADRKHYVDRNAASGAQRKTIVSGQLGITGDLRDSVLGGGVNSFDAALAFGKTDYLPGTEQIAPQYKKVTYNFTRLQGIVPGSLLGFVSVRGQWAFDNLDNTEQFRLGGPDGIRAFAPGEGTGDTGVLATVELRALPATEESSRWVKEMVISVFADWGQIKQRHDASGKPFGFDNHQTYGGLGLGVSWVRPNEYSLRLSLARPFTGVAVSDTARRDPRAYLTLSRYF